MKVECLEDIIGFGDDPNIRDEIASMIQRNDIKVAIETGTFKGSTTLALHKLCDRVLTCEINSHVYNLTKTRFMYHNVDNLIEFHNSSSPRFLSLVLPEFVGQNVLLYLDAHWGGSPLREELRQISTSGVIPFIAIHDMKVPGKEFGYDSYNGQDYEYEWIQDLVDDIYPSGCNKYYNEKVAGRCRGVLYLTPLSDKPRLES